MLQTRAVRADRFQFRVQSSRNAKPFLDAMLANCLEVMFVSNSTIAVPTKAGNFKAATPRPQANRGERRCNCHASPILLEVVQNGNQLTRIEPAFLLLPLLNPGESVPRIRRQQEFIGHDATDTLLPGICVDSLEGCLQ
jgi:hypothetical protein